jgi:hypothetical protein
MYASTTGGAILVQSTSLSIADSSLTGNTAGGDAGALFAQAPTGLDIAYVTFADNVAERGVGAAAVLRGAGAAVAAGVKGCSFTGNTAKLGNGGAVVIDSGLGALDVACKGCKFESNKAGAAPATQLLRLTCAAPWPHYLTPAAAGLDCTDSLLQSSPEVLLLLLVVTLLCELSVMLCGRLQAATEAPLQQQAPPASRALTASQQQTKQASTAAGCTAAAAAAPASQQAAAAVTRQAQRGAPSAALIAASSQPSSTSTVAMWRDLAAQ